MIRLAKKEDLKRIMEMVNQIKIDMKKEQNPQWHSGYPLLEDFLLDLKKKSLYVLEDNHMILAFACIMEDVDDDYKQILNRTKEKSYVIHRLAVDRDVRSKGYAKQLMKFAENLSLEKKAFYLKGDTEIHNHKMNRLFENLGFQKKGELHWSDNDGTYYYYEKKLGSDNREV